MNKSTEALLHRLVLTNPEDPVKEFRDEAARILRMRHERRLFALRLRDHPLQTYIPGAEPFPDVGPSPAVVEPIPVPLSGAEPFTPTPPPNAA